MYPICNLGTMNLAKWGNSKMILFCWIFYHLPMKPITHLTSSKRLVELFYDIRRTYVEGVQESVACCYLLSGILNIYFSFMFFGILCFNQKVYITFTIRKTNYKPFSILENSNKTILRWCPIDSGDIFNTWM